LHQKRGVVFGVANDRSIAWAVAKELHQHGAELAFNYLGAAQEKRIKALLASQMPNAFVAPCDVSQDREIETFFKSLGEHWQNIDFIIHCLAYTDKECLKESFVQTTRQQFALTLDISAYSLIALSRMAAPMMSAGGSIVSMSYYGAQKVIPNYNIMGVAKSALESTSRYLAADLGPRGIRVNCISAGPIKTLSASAIPGIRTLLESAESIAPLRRGTSAQDVGKATVYLVSDLSEGVTGDLLYVDCGLNIIGLTNMADG